MSPQPPRKPRSGRRQFPGGMHGGTPKEWKQVMSSPHVEQALRDPAIQQALYHNLQTSIPGGMSSVVPPEAPAPPDQPPVRMQSGGGMSDPNIQALLNDPSIPEATKARIRIAAANQDVAGVPGVASSSTMSGLGKLAGAGPATAGNTAAAMGMGALMGLGTTRQQGLSSLVGAATAGALNYFIRKYGKSKQPGGAKSATQSQVGNAQGMAGTTSTDEPNVTRSATTPAAPAAPAAPGGASSTATPPGYTEVPVAEPWRTNPDTSSAKDAEQKSQSPTSTETATAPGTASGGYGGPGQGLWMASGNSSSGSVMSYDGGKTWVDQETKKPFTGDVANKTQISPPISPSSSLMNATPATTAPATPSVMLGQPPPTEKVPPVSMRTETPKDETSGLGLIPDYSPDTSMLDVGLKKGGPVPKGVLVRKPMGMPIPVLHTTIVIAAKPKVAGKKKEAKQAGGVLVPPRRGPQDDSRPRAHGRVQVPRGSGAAIKGKRFGGIF